MAAPPKHMHRSGYSREETEQVEATCLTMAVTLGAYADRFCIVGGLVPSLIIDRASGPDPETESRHPGTSDLDVGLEIALLDDQQYKEISKRLRQEGFEPDRNEDGNLTPQRWCLKNLEVTIDFLLPPVPGGERGGRVQPLEADFGALIAPGLQLAPSERQDITLDGSTLKGEKVRRTIPVCGPATFAVLKAFAFRDRGEPKDAYDLVYVLERWSGGVADIAERLEEHANRHREVVRSALELLVDDFASADSIGPLRAAEFVDVEGVSLDDDAADAHGYVDDMLRHCRERGLLEQSE